jgi:hypothetical protein
MRSLLLCALLASAAHAQPCTPGFRPGEPGSSGIADPFSAYVSPMTPFNGRLIIGGAFSQAGPLATNIVAAFDPASATWSQLGGNVNPGNTNIYAAALATFPVAGVHSLVMGGQFASVRNGPTSVPDTAGLAAWDGSRWSSLATGWQPATGKSVWALLDWQRSDGQRWLVVGGGWDAIGAASADGIAYYDADGWHNIAGPSDLGIAGPFSPVVFAAAIYQSQLYIAGRFASVNGVSAPLIARWNGSAWQRPGAIAAGSTVSDITCLFVFNDGSGEKLYAGGYDLRIGGLPTSVAVWNGSVWSRVGQNLGGRTTSLAAFNDGSATRLFGGWTADAQQNYLYRLESNTWSVAGGGVSVPLTGNFPSIFGLRAWNGSLFVGGNFQLAGGIPSYGIARFASCIPCDPDFNADGNIDQDDVAYLVNILAGGPNPQSRDPDFNLDGNADQGDYIALVNVIAGGPCP